MENKWTGERTIWFNPKDHLEEFQKVHNWYMEAMKYCIGKIVVDVGCGHAFGSFLLSLVAEKVHGIDKNDLTDTDEVLPIHDFTFHMMDLDKEPVDITSDVCVAIELIEHLNNPEDFLKNLKSKALFFTVPCYGNKNEFHMREYSEESLKKLITENYSPELTYKMENRRMIGYAIKKETNNEGNKD